MKKKQPIEKWIEVVATYEKTGKTTECPFCHKATLTIQEIQMNRKSLFIQCLNCGKTAHFN